MDCLYEEQQRWSPALHYFGLSGGNFQSGFPFYCIRVLCSCSQFLFTDSKVAIKQLEP